VPDARLIGQVDQESREAAEKESRFLITQDLDFSDSRTFCSWFSSRHFVDTASLSQSMELGWADHGAIPKRKRRRVVGLLCCGLGTQDTRPEASEKEEAIILFRRLRGVIFPLHCDEMGPAHSQGIPLS